MKAKNLPIVAWTLVALVSLTAFLAWGQGIDWRAENISGYRLFPLFGLLALSLMWTHYIMGAVRRYFGASKKVLKPYFEATGWAVLILICLHPGLLWYLLWRDGFGLPPNSYLQYYVAPTLRWVAMLGTASLLVFLAFELKRWFDKKQWWKYVEYANAAALVAIFYHGLRLGTNLQEGWFRLLWLLYGLTLIASLVFIYIYEDKNKTKEKK